MTPRKLVPMVALCGTIALTIGGAAWFGGVGSSGIENTAISDREATRGAAPLCGDAAGAAGAASVGAAADPDPSENAAVLAGSSAAKVSVLEAPLPESRPPPQSEPRVRLVTLSTLKEVKEYPKPAVRPIEAANECLVAEICIDEYLWSLYEEPPKSTPTR
ncbi:MAG: hypothetical protein K2Z80_01315 [Xanthobacteraceae bacterium]|nr:hypothetical protein [Xanthobacteraceae bacterium]